MGKFHQCLTELSAHDMIMAGYYMKQPVHKEELQQRNCLGMVHRKTETSFIYAKPRPEF